MKILKNTTITDISLNETGITIPASGQVTLNETEYAQVAFIDSITELTTYLNSGDIVVNNGTVDLTAAEGLRYLSISIKPSIEANDSSISRYIKTINFEGDINVSDDGDGKVTVNIDPSESIFTEYDCGEVITNGNIDYYDSVGGVSITSEATIIFDTTRNGSDLMVYNVSSGETTFKESGKFSIQSTVSIDNTNTSRSTAKIFVQLDTGSGFVTIPGIEAYTYNRTSASAENSASISTILDVNSGDKIRVRGVRNSGSGALLTIANGSNITISRLNQNEDVNILGISCGDIADPDPDNNILDCGEL